MLGSALADDSEGGETSNSMLTFTKEQAHFACVMDLMDKEVDFDRLAEERLAQAAAARKMRRKQRSRIKTHGKQLVGPNNTQR